MKNDIRTAQSSNEQIHQMGEVLEWFYKHYAGYVYQLSQFYLKDKMEAEDLCHDVILEAVSKLDQYDALRGTIEAWLSVRVKSRAIDRLDMKKRWKLCDVTDKYLRNESEQYIEDKVMRSFEHERIRNALKLLPKAQQKAIYGKYFQYYTQQQLANQLERPIGTVKSLIRYGLNNLRKHFIEPSAGQPSMNHDAV